MKKIIISTIFKVCNYGTVLQAYATQKFLQEQNYNVKILNYEQERLKTRNLLFTSNKDKTNIKNRLYRMLSILYRMPGNIIIKHKFNIFVKKYLKLTEKEYLNKEENNMPEADVYITGSDQVWNSDYNNGIDSVYYLKNVPNKTKKISYAASIGMEDFKQNEKEEIKELLKRYNSIGVRELSAQKAIENMKLDAKVVLDPTFLLTKKEWNNIASDSIKENGYLLLYILGRDKTLIQYAEKIAKKRNLKIVKVGLDFLYSKSINKTFTYATPNEFLKLFMNADYIITNSFHGIAFSINFNKQFIAISPKSYNTRLISILTLFNLENRLITDEKQINIHDIDYEKVNVKLNELRDQSSNFLKGAIEG